MFVEKLFFKKLSNIALTDLTKINFIAGDGNYGKSLLLEEIYNGVLGHVNKNEVIYISKPRDITKELNRIFKNSDFIKEKLLRDNKLLNKFLSVLYRYFYKRKEEQVMVISENRIDRIFKDIKKSGITIQFIFCLMFSIDTYALVEQNVKKVILVDDMDNYLNYKQIKPFWEDIYKAEGTQFFFVIRHMDVLTGFYKFSCERKLQKTTNEDTVSLLLLYKKKDSVLAARYNEESLMYNIENNNDVLG